MAYHLCDGKTFPFPDNTFDRIFMVTVIGEVENKTAYMEAFYRMMKPDGVLSISELAGDPDKMTIVAVQELAMASGFECYRQYGNERGYTLNFKKTQVRKGSA